MALNLILLNPEELNDLGKSKDDQDKQNERLSCLQTAVGIFLLCDEAFMHKDLVGPVSDLTTRPFYSVKVHPRPSKSPVIDSSVLAFPWSLPTYNRTQQLLYSCPVSFSGPALSAWLHAFARPLS